MALTWFLTVNLRRPILERRLRPAKHNEVDYAALSWCELPQEPRFIGNRQIRRNAEVSRRAAGAPVDAYSGMGILDALEHCEPRS
jgi:hypothetical protein